MPSGIQKKGQKKINKSATESATIERSIFGKYLDYRDNCEAVDSESDQSEPSTVITIESPPSEPIRN